MYKVVIGLLYDRYNPERTFKKNTVIKVNDPERAKDMLARRVIVPTNDVEEYEEFDPVPTEEEVPVKKSSRKKKSS